MSNRFVALAALAVLSWALGPLEASAGAEQAAVIDGKWRVENGGTVEISRCGQAHCITIRTGPYKGRQIGRMTGSNGSYSGEITDPQTDRTYSGTAKIEERALTLTGCALKIFCRSQHWTRQ